MARPKPLPFLLLCLVAGAPSHGRAEPAPPALHGQGLDAYRTEPLGELWRWRRLEALEQAKVRLVSAQPDGSLLLLSGEGTILRYDGTNLDPVPLPPGANPSPIVAIKTNTRGDTCIVTTDSVLVRRDGKVTQVASVGQGRRTFSVATAAADGTFWVGTQQGILRVDPATGTSQLTPSPRPVLNLCEGPGRDSVWVSLAPRGDLWECPVVDGRPATFDTWVRRRAPMEREVVRTNLMRASDGSIWMIAEDHTLPCLRFDPRAGTWEEIRLSSFGGDDFTFSILETLDGTVCISSRGALHAYRDGKWSIFSSPDFPVPGARTQLELDQAGYLYLAEVGGSTLRIDLPQQGGLSLRDLHFQGTTRDGDRVFLSSRGSVLVVGPDDRVRLDDGPATTGLDTPVAVKAARDGRLYLAGSHGGAAAVAVHDGSGWTRHRFPEFAVSIGHLGILERANGELWFGCAQEPAEFPGYQGGILRFRPRPDGGHDIERISPPLVPFRGWLLREGPDGSVYVSGNGLYRVHDRGFEPVSLPEPIRNLWIDHVEVDAAGDLWVGIWSSGLHRRSGSTWEVPGGNRGLPNLLVSYLLAQGERPPLVSTRDGLYRYDDGHWSPYLGGSNGLHRGSGHLVADGDGLWVNRAYVGWYYRAQRPDQNPRSTYQGFGTTQHVRDRLPPDTAWRTPPAQLTRERAMVVEVEGLDAWSQTRSDDLEYAYRVGDGAWSPFSPERRILVEGLGGGSQRIEVRARDADFNVDPTPVVASFTVLVPLWQQGWFIATVLGVVAVFVALLALFVRQRIRHLLELEEVKMRFFTEISHEIKTPLSLILGPVERLQNEITDSNHQHYLSLIKSSSQRLLHLVNQLLDFRKLQLRQLQYRAEVADFLPFARSSTTVFGGWAANRGLDLAFESTLDQLVFAFDPDLFHKLLDNLVNNAVKYTPNGGRVRVRVERFDGPDGRPHGRLEVEDDGPGIPAAEQQKVFEPFFRASSSGHSAEGTGVGLALVKELAETIGGRVILRSPSRLGTPERPGCCFAVEFPLPGLDSTAVEPPAAAQPAAGPANAAEGEGPEEQDLVLIVEDNRDLRHFLAGELGRQLRVQTADSAEEGLRLARELVPDLILSDVVLPGMSGIDLSRTLKQDPLTSHVPVLLLTALRSDAHKQQAYESGAEDFLTKPISPEILRLKVRNLLGTQRKVRERVQARFVEEKRVTGLAEAEQAFVDKAEAVVEEHLGDEHFDVVVLAQKMGFSRSAFYRKFNAITNVSPASYIKTKRLKRAANLLAEGRLTVTEIAFEVGFSDSGYFSRVFKEEYGSSPSEFARLGDKR